MASWNIFGKMRPGFRMYHCLKQHYCPSIYLLFHWRMFVCFVASSQYIIYQCNLSSIESNRNTNLIPMDKLKQIWMEFHFHEIHIQRKPFPSIFIVFPCLVITLTNQWNVASIYGGANTFHLIQTTKEGSSCHLPINSTASRITHNLSIQHIKHSTCRSWTCILCWIEFLDCVHSREKTLFDQRN